jgi:hypothetical protein
MFTGEIPPRPILLHGQFMAGSEMVVEDLAARAAFRADDIIAVDGLPDRDRGGSFSLSAVARLPSEGLMHSRH